MNILVIGSGGREHALVWKIKQSPKAEKIYCAPGNGGIEGLADCVDISVNDIKGLIDFAKKNDIGLTVVGPEAPLVNGIVDEFEANGLRIFGPNKDASQLEGSKVFSKEFMYENNIPTAPFETFDDIFEAKDFISQVDFPLVIKADGLAAGKGVIICDDITQANDALDQIMSEKVFQEAGNSVVIEECLEGEEVSILAVSDGKNFVILDSSQDHKRIFDDDLGPNTGGMGAYSPAPILNSTLKRMVENQIIGPTIRGMSEAGSPFKGVLYAGLMITEEGPMVLEYNVRLGDPETQAVLPRMKADIVDLMLASCEGKVRGFEIKWEDKACVCVVISSGGYPGKYEKGKEIKGLDSIKEEDAIVFHAGTKRSDGKILTSGGRVLGVIALGDGIKNAIDNVYVAVEKISFNRCFFRRDIGAKALKFIKDDKRVTSII